MARILQWAIGRTLEIETVSGEFDDLFDLLKPEHGGEPLPTMMEWDVEDAMECDGFIDSFYRVSPGLQQPALYQLTNRAMKPFVDHLEAYDVATFFFPYQRYMAHNAPYPVAPGQSYPPDVLERLHKIAQENLSHALAYIERYFGDVDGPAREFNHVHHLKMLAVQVTLR